MPIQVGEQTVHFNHDSTRWLGVWLDSALTLRDNRQRCIARARQAESRLRHLVTTYGVPPASARNLQTAIVRCTMLYAAELTWNGSKGMEGEYQAAINRMGRATLGVFRSTPLGTVAGESGLVPARALLDHRQARFGLRLLARPQNVGGQEEILERRAELRGRIAGKTGLCRRKRVEKQVWSAGKTFPGRVVVQKEADALGVARGWGAAARTAWTDGSRLENGKVEAAVVWRKR